MAAQSSMLVVLTILLTVGLVALGVGMMLYGLFRKRRGSAPYCRSCSYNLTGTVSSRCSECGVDLETRDAIVIGKPVRRRLPIVAGSFILLVGLVPVVFTLGGAGRNINWYELQPVVLVMWDMRVGDPATATRALRELQRRASQGELSLHQQTKLIEACLAEQGRKVERATVTHDAVEYLGDLYVAGKLTPEQAKGMFAGVIQSLRLEVRPRILKGNPLPYRRHHAHRGPPSFWVRHVVNSIRIDGCQNRELGAYSGSRGWGSGLMGTSIRIPGTDAGNHTMEMDIEVEISPGGHDADPVYRHTHTISAPFEILSDEPEDYITLVDSPKIGDTLAATIALRAMSIRPPVEDGQVRARLDFRVSKPLPIGVAFDVSVESEGRKIGRASLSLSSGANTESQGVSLLLPASVGDTVAIRLRPSKKRAARTVDLFEIWDGELLFKSIPVVRLDPDLPSVKRQLHSPTVVTPD